jgi:hypothetical protein
MRNLLVSCALLIRAIMSTNGSDFLPRAVVCSGAGTLDEGSVVTLGQPFVGLANDLDNSVGARTGLIPVLQQQLAATNEFIFTVEAGFENSDFVMRFFVPPARTWVVEGSTNLVEWQAIWSATATDPWVVFKDATAFLYPRRFYRLFIP